MARKLSAIAHDYRDVFGTPAGQRVLAHIMAHCKVYDVIQPRPDKDDADRVFFDLGARNVALMIASYLAYRPNEFVERAREHNAHLNGDLDAI